MKNKIVVIVAVVAAVMAVGIGSALAFGGPPADDAQNAQNRYRDTLPDTDGDGYGDCDGTCDGVANAPQDGTGNRYGMQSTVCGDGTCPAEAPGYGNADCDGTRDGIAPRNGSGSQHGRNR